MNSKQSILSAIRQHSIASQEAADLDRDWISFDNPVEQFRTVLEMVGGQSVLLQNMNGIVAALNELPPYQSATKVFSSIDRVENANVDFESIDDPHDLQDVDFAILKSEFGVAENGALWVTDAGLKHRVIYFIPQHLALVVSASAIVNNMHEAYQRLEFATPQFGTFISGPSKTADIEQSLVIGAHGARSLTVFLIDE